MRWLDPTNREPDEAYASVRVADLDGEFEAAQPRFWVGYAAAYLAEALRGEYARGGARRPAPDRGAGGRAHRRPGGTRARRPDRPRRIGCAETTKGRPGRAALSPGRAYLPVDVQVERGGHLGVQPDLHLVCADRLDVAGQLEPAPVEGRAAGGLDRVDDLGRGDRAEQPAAVAGAGRQADLEALELALDLVGVAEVADLAGRTGPLDGRDLLLGALGPADARSPAAAGSCGRSRP